MKILEEGSMTEKANDKFRKSSMTEETHDKFWGRQCE